MSKSKKEKNNAIVSKKFYSDNKNDYDNYKDVQKNHTSRKLSKKRNINEYKIVSNKIKSLINNKKLNYVSKIINENQPINMICLGARNEWEKKSFNNFLNDKEVGSFKVEDLDIQKKSKCNYTLDFNNLPSDWNEKWDIIYSNSIDHAYDGDKTLLEWHRVLKIGGILILGISSINILNEGQNSLSAQDSCLYKEMNDLIDYFKNSKKFNLIDCFGRIKDKNKDSKKSFKFPSQSEGTYALQFNYFILERTKNGQN